MHESFADRAQRMAEKFEAEPLIYMLGSGPSYGSARQESICVFMEMQWINSAVIHSGDFFHGPFEMTDEKNAFIVLVNDGKTRDLDERVVRFLAKHNAKFEALDAKEYGIEEAIIISSLFFWILKNEANDVNEHDGAYWTCCSTDAMEILFPYMSKNTIYRTIQKLVSKGVIKKGFFNTNPFDRTAWYTFTEKGILLLQKK